MATLTLRDSGGSYSATLRYPKADGAYPRQPKTFTKDQLTDGTYVYDYPSTAILRRWVLDIDGENTGDALLSTLNSLYALTEDLLLDEDALIVESNINVHFEEFRPVYQSGTHYIYRLVLQETN